MKISIFDDFNQYVSSGSNKTDDLCFIKNIGVWYQNGKVKDGSMPHPDFEHSEPCHHPHYEPCHPHPDPYHPPFHNCHLTAIEIDGKYLWVLNGKLVLDDKGEPIVAKYANSENGDGVFGVDAINGLTGKFEFTGDGITLDDHTFTIEGGTKLSDWAVAYLKNLEKNAGSCKVTASASAVEYGKATNIVFTITLSDGAENKNVSLKSVIVDGLSVEATGSNGTYTVSKTLDSTAGSMSCEVSGTVNGVDKSASASVKAYAYTYCGFSTDGSIPANASKKLGSTMSGMQFSINNTTGTNAECYVWVPTANLPNPTTVVKTSHRTDEAKDIWDYVDAGSTTIGGVTYSIYRNNKPQIPGTSYNIVF